VKSVTEQMLQMSIISVRLELRRKKISQYSLNDSSLKHNGN